MDKLVIVVVGVGGRVGAGSFFEAVAVEVVGVGGREVERGDGGGRGLVD